MTTAEAASAVGARSNAVRKTEARGISDCGQAVVIDVRSCDRPWPRQVSRSRARTPPGVATGLAVTGVGGDVLFVEACARTAPGLGSGQWGT